MKAIKMSVLFLIIFAVQAHGLPRYTLFPQFVSGQGWSTELYFTNQGLSKVSEIAVNFYDSSGLALVVETDFGTATGFIFNLEAGATKVIRAIPSTTLHEGYAVIHYPWTGSPARATEIFRNEQSGITTVEVGVPQQERGDHFSFLVEENASQLIHTAIAIVNPRAFDSTDQTFIVNLIRPDEQHPGDYCCDNSATVLDYCFLRMKLMISRPGTTLKSLQGMALATLP
jgi:hypothetical protein